MIELLSIDLSNYCSKQCTFCYNHSHKDGNTMWKPQEVIDFALDCVAHGVKSVSLGGGEPFEYEGIFEVIDALYPKCYISVTTNGLPLEADSVWSRLMAHKPDKVQVSIHQPQEEPEVDRVVGLINRLTSANIAAGLNLLVGADNIEEAKIVYARTTEVVSPNRLILIPQRYNNTPTPKQLASVAGGRPFQSPSCLLKCSRPENFASVSWDKRVNSCSYAPGKQSLETLDFQGLQSALERVNWESCSQKD